MENTERDMLFKDAAEVVVKEQTGSASLLQRRLKVGYMRSRRLISELEEAGIVEPFNESELTPRMVNIKTLEELQLFLNTINQ